MAVSWGTDTCSASLSTTLTGQIPWTWWRSGGEQRKYPLAFGEDPDHVLWILALAHVALWINSVYFNTLLQTIGPRLQCKDAKMPSPHYRNQRVASWQQTHLVKTGMNHNLRFSPNTCSRFLRVPTLKPFLSGPLAKTGAEKASKKQIWN